MKFVCPMTEVATALFVSGDAKTRSLLLPLSETLRFPLLSKANPQGPKKVSAAGLLLLRFASP